MLDRSPQWVEADLRRLIIDQVQESVGLDYKAAGALGKQDQNKREIGRDVSAFANSAGGVIVYGMTENGHVPTAIDPIASAAFSKEWLENVIISNIQPRVDGSHINPVLLAGNPLGRVVYVVTIPQSYTAHQASDNRYYKRFNFQSVPMEHYEVQDTMNRAKTPIIDVRIKCQTERRDHDLHRYSLLVFLDNKGSVGARNMKLTLSLPAGLQPDTWGLAREEIAGVVRCKRRYSDAVLFPKDSLFLGEMGAGIAFDIDDARFRYVQQVNPSIEWTIYADDMARREGAVRVADLIEF